MFALREAVLLCTIFFCLSSARVPNEGQRCEAEGRTGVCVKWHKCAPIAEILRRYPHKQSELIYAEKFKCGYKERVPYYCCVDGMSAQPEAPPPQITEKQITTDENKQIGFNALMNHTQRTLIPLETCGLIKYIHVIVGGEQATLGEYPWIAAIHYQHQTGPGRFMCGGALINKHYVLTAAHCLHRDKLFGFYPDMVRLGAHNLETDTDIEHGTDGRLIQADPAIDFMIEEMIIHEDYVASSENQHDDIGLIRLRGEAPETNYVSPICLPTPEVDEEIISSDEYLQVAGWGKTENGTRSSILMKVLIPIEDFETCAQKYSYLGVNLTRNQLCAGMSGRDSCLYDSGGPLMGTGKYSNYEYSRYFAVGLVSYGPINCGQYDIPGVYTRVLPYVGWILDHMEP